MTPERKWIRSIFSNLWFQTQECSAIKEFISFLFCFFFFLPKIDVSLGCKLDRIWYKAMVFIMFIDPWWEYAYVLLQKYCCWRMMVSDLRLIGCHVISNHCVLWPFPNLQLSEFSKFWIWRNMEKGWWICFAFIFCTASHTRYIYILAYEAGREPLMFVLVAEYNNTHLIHFCTQCMLWNVCWSLPTFCWPVPPPPKAQVVSLYTQWSLSFTCLRRQWAKPRLSLYLFLPLQKPWLNYHFCQFCHNKLCLGWFGFASYSFYGLLCVKHTILN